MSKKIKVILSLIGIVISIVLASCVILFTKSTNMDISSKVGDSTIGDNNSGMNSNMKPPSDTDKNSSSNMQTPPSMPSSDNTTNDSNNTNTPPKRPNDMNDSNNRAASNMPTANNDIRGNKTEKLNWLDTCLLIASSLIFSFSFLYLLFSKFGNRVIFTSKDKGIIYLLIVFILTGILSITIIYLSNNYLFKNNTQNKMDNMDNMNNSTSQSVEASAIYELSKDGVIQENKTYTSNDSDESCVLVKNGGNLQLNNSTLAKSSGDTTNTENSEFYGINAALLTQKASTANITNTNITTSAKGANAVFSTGDNSKIYISNSNITTTSDSSRGLDATYGGYIEADNVTISTKGTSCATLATDRGEGTVIAKNSNLTTEGKGSPIIYSTGNITLEKSTGISKGSQLVVVEGKNSANVNDSVLKSSGIGNRNNVDNCGVMIYQSMSGDASNGNGSFSSKNSTLEISNNSNVYNSAPMFFVTNTDANISLENTNLIYGSNLLLDVKGTNEWGTQGSNGGNVTFNANNQELIGNIQVDNISTLKLNLQNSTTLTGSINNEKTAKQVDISIDESSSWDVTSTSYVSTITLSNNDISLIKDNGNTIYYDKDKNSWLEGKTVTLNNGGKLEPNN